MKNETKIRSLLGWYLIGGICAFLLMFIAFQYVIFKNTYNQNLLREASYIEHSLRNILEDYKITLEMVSKEIKEKDLFSDKNHIADYLEKTYAYGIEKENREKVRTLGINWVATANEEFTPIGRLGEVKHKLTFSSEYIKKLEKNSEKLETSEFLPEKASLGFLYINLGMGVRDNNGKYRGFVNARIDINSLKEVLSANQERSVQFILLNDKEEEIISSLPVKLRTNENEGGVEKFKEFLKENIFPQEYVFPIQLPVNKFSYVLRFGYSQYQFYMLFLKQFYFTFILLCSFLLLCSFFSYFYHRKFIKKSLKFYKEKNRGTNIKISHLTEENHRLSIQENKLEKYIKTAEQADKEEKKFCLEINKRISHSLSNMLDIANFLLNRIQEQNKIEENPEELMEAFEKAYFYSRFFTLKDEEELVSMDDVLHEALLVLSKQILKKELHVKFLKEKVPTVLTDKTALKQVLINILVRAIKNSPKKGEINLTLFSQEENILFECKDNGYLAEYPLKEQNTREAKGLSLDSMSLEREDMEKLVKSLGGAISTLYKPYKGNTLLLKIPYQIINEEEKITTNNDNIVRFVALKKER